MLYCVPSYYVLCFGLLLGRRFQVRQGTFGKFLRNLHRGQFLPCFIGATVRRDVDFLDLKSFHIFFPSDTTIIQAPVPLLKDTELMAQGSY